jgi:hypothetical protein
LNKSWLLKFWSTEGGEFGNDKILKLHRQRPNRLSLLRLPPQQFHLLLHIAILSLVPQPLDAVTRSVTSSIASRQSVPSRILPPMQEVWPPHLDVNFSLEDEINTE